MQTDRNSDLVFCGEYVNQLDLPPYTLSSTNTSGFVAKITDYYIDRGDVSSGPYCAGDTFLVPYVQYGVYDSSNYFIAELSDEHGNFDGGEKELGRLKSIK